MPIQFDIPTYSINALPPKYRLPKFILFIQAILYPLNWRFGLFKQYQTGSNYALYNSSTSYSIGQRVQYNFSIYESQSNSNSGNNPQTDNINWQLVNTYFIGANERVLYNGRYLNLTYQLNRYFQKQLNENGFIGFRQPPYPFPYGNDEGAGGQFSDIYITTVEPSFTSFVVGATESNSSDVFLTLSTGFVFTASVYGNGTTYTFAINIPVSVYNSLGANDTIRKSIVSGFVNKYLISGTNFIIITY